LRISIFANFLGFSSTIESWEELAEFVVVKDLGMKDEEAVKASTDDPPERATSSAKDNFIVGLTFFYFLNPNCQVNLYLMGLLRKKYCICVALLLLL